MARTKSWLSSDSTVFRVGGIATFVIAIVFFISAVVIPVVTLVKQNSEISNSLDNKGDLLHLPSINSSDTRKFVPGKVYLVRYDIPSDKLDRVATLRICLSQSTARSVYYVKYSIARPPGTPGAERENITSFSGGGGCHITTFCGGSYFSEFKGSEYATNALLNVTLVTPPYIATCDYSQYKTGRVVVGSVLSVSGVAILLCAVGCLWKSKSLKKKEGESYFDDDYSEDALIGSPF